MKRQADPDQTVDIDMESAQDLPANPLQDVNIACDEAHSPSSYPSSSGMTVTHSLTVAGGALQHIQRNRPQIDSVFAESGIQKHEYALLAGFDESLIPEGIDLEQIHIFTSADVVADSPLLAQLGKILSPFSSLLFTESFPPHRLPVFKPDGTLWEFNELVASTFSGRRSTVAVQSIVKIHSQTSGGDQGGEGSGDDSGPGRGQKTRGDAEKQCVSRDGEAEEQKNGEIYQDRPDGSNERNDEAHAKPAPNMVCSDI